MSLLVATLAETVAISGSYLSRNRDVASGRWPARASATGAASAAGGPRVGALAAIPLSPRSPLSPADRN